MRVSYSSLMIAFVLVGGAFAACSGDNTVFPPPTTTGVTTTGSGGGGGAGGATTTSTTTSSTTTSTSSGFGGGNACDMACQKIEQCDIMNVTCGQFMMFVDCESDLGICIGECVLDVECAELPSLLQNNPCVTACQGGQGGAGGGGDCLSCATGSCLTQAAACLDDPACALFVECAQNCPQGDDACLLTCAANNPSPATQALADCACNNCAGSCPCPGTGVGGAGGAGGAMGAGGASMAVGVGVGGAGGA